MPIIFPADFPIPKTLLDVEILMRTHAAVDVNINTVRIGILNLMPNKQQTAMQLAKVLGWGGTHVEIVLIKLQSHVSKTTCENHIHQFYRTIEHTGPLDGIIITGAPVEHLEYDEVSYWAELQEIMAWAAEADCPTIGICWGAMALAKFHHNIEKHALSKKAFGCFAHWKNRPDSAYMREISDPCLVPISRRSALDKSEIDRCPALETLLTGTVGGPAIIQDKSNNALLVLNHFEYDDDTLELEYNRDITNGYNIEIPVNYFPGNNPRCRPINKWRPEGQRLFGNWLSEICFAKLR
jgi:homoserine O-succinyltransferase